jgi:hypothetical protein
LKYERYNRKLRELHTKYSQKAPTTETVNSTLSQRDTQLPLISSYASSSRQPLLSLTAPRPNKESSFHIPDLKRGAGPDLDELLGRDTKKQKLTHQNISAEVDAYLEDKMSKFHYSIIIMMIANQFSRFQCQTYRYSRILEKGRASMALFSFSCS